MQWRKPQNRKLVLEALQKTDRQDLIGFGKHCLVRPDKGAPTGTRPKQEERRGKPGKKMAREDTPTKHKPSAGGGKKAGWAKAKPKNTKGRGINKKK